MNQIIYKFICTLQIWDLQDLDLQSKTMTIDKASGINQGTNKPDTKYS